MPIRMQKQERGWKPRRRNSNRGTVPLYRETTPRELHLTVQSHRKRSRSRIQFQFIFPLRTCSRHVKTSENRYHIDIRPQQFVVPTLRSSTGFKMPSLCVLLPILWISIPKQQACTYQVDIYSLSSVDPQTSSLSNSSGSSELVPRNRPGASVTRHLFLESFDLYSMMTTCDLAAALPILSSRPNWTLELGVSRIMMA